VLIQRQYGTRHSEPGSINERQRRRQATLGRPDDLAGTARHGLTNFRAAFRQLDHGHVVRTQRVDHLHRLWALRQPIQDGLGDNIGAHKIALLLATGLHLNSPRSDDRRRETKRNQIPALKIRQSTERAIDGAGPQDKTVEPCLSGMSPE